MLKLIVGGLAGVLLYFPPVVAQSTAQQQSPQIIAQMAPRGSNETVSPLELQQFAQALRQLRKVEMETQEKMAEALKAERLSPERFQEIGQQRSNPDSPVGGTISPGEQEKFDKILAKIQTIRQEAIPKRSRAITLQGLTIERFNQIGEVIDRNATLRQQLQNSF